MVAVRVGVGVRVPVGVGVSVKVRVLVGLDVGVAVGVGVGDAVNVGVGVEQGCPQNRISQLSIVWRVMYPALFGLVELARTNPKAIGAPLHEKSGC